MNLKNLLLKLPLSEDRKTSLWASSVSIKGMGLFQVRGACHAGVSDQDIDDLVKGFKKVLENGQELRGYEQEHALQPFASGD